MENREQIRQPEIKTEELLTLIDTVQWEQGYEFSFNGTEFFLDITEIEALQKADAEGRKEKYGLPAEYIRSTYVNGYDIYLHDTIPTQERKRILFHEILEANLRDQRFSQSQAHDITINEEEKVFGKREK